MIGAVLFACVLSTEVRAQDEDVDPIPDPMPALEGPNDPFGLGVKKLAYSVGMKIAEIYDDNVFLAPEAEESDRITTLLLRTRVRYDFGEGAAALNYRGRERLFADHTEFNGMEHFLDGSVTRTLSNLKFEAGLEWTALKDPFDVLQVTDRVDSRFARGRLLAGADFNRLDIEVTGAISRFTLDDDVLDRGDYLRREAGVLAAVEAWPRASAFAEVRFQQTDYDEPDFSDFDFLRVDGGIRGAFTAKLRGEARIGLGRVETEGGGIFPVDAFTEFVAAAFAVWEISEKQELRAELSRRPIESVLTGLAIADGVRVGYRWTFSERWTAQGEVSWDREEESDGSNLRRGLHVRGGVQWAFWDRYHADLGVLHRSRRSDDPGLEYENFRISLGIGVEW